MKNSIKAGIFFGIVGIVIGILISNYFKMWIHIAPTFFDVTLLEIIQFLIYCYFGYYLYYYSTQRFSDQRKKKEIYFCLLEELNKLISENEIKIIEKLESKMELSDRREILSILRKISNKISTINKIKFCKENKKLDCKLTEIQKKYNNLKEIITGDEWNVIESYDDNAIDEIKKIFPLLYITIDEARIEIF